MQSAYDRRRTTPRLLIPLLLGLALTGCATPPALPLPTKPRLADNLNALRHDDIDPTARLTVTQIALLVVQPVAADHHDTLPPS